MKRKDSGLDPNRRRWFVLSVYQHRFGPRCDRLQSAVRPSCRYTAASFFQVGSFYFFSTCIDAVKRVRSFNLFEAKRRGEKKLRTNFFFFFVRDDGRSSHEAGKDVRPLWMRQLPLNETCFKMEPAVF